MTKILPAGKFLSTTTVEGLPAITFPLTIFGKDDI